MNAPVRPSAEMVPPDTALLNDWHVVAFAMTWSRVGSFALPCSARICILWRSANGDVHVWKDLCIHRGARLSRGWIAEDTVVCPYHGWRYDKTAKCVLVPAAPDSAPPLKARAFPHRAVEQYGMIWVTLGEPLATYRFFRNGKIRTSANSIPGPTPIGPTAFAPSRTSLTQRTSPSFMPASTVSPTLPTSSRTTRYSRMRAGSARPRSPCISPMAITARFRSTPATCTAAFAHSSRISASGCELPIRRSSIWAAPMTAFAPFSRHSRWTRSIASSACALPSISAKRSPRLTFVSGKTPCSPRIGDRGNPASRAHPRRSAGGVPSPHGQARTGLPPLACRPGRELRHGVTSRDRRAAIPRGMKLRRQRLRVVTMRRDGPCATSQVRVRFAAGS